MYALCIDNIINIIHIIHIIHIIIVTNEWFMNEKRTHDTRSASLFADDYAPSLLRHLEDYVIYNKPVHYS